MYELLDKINSPADLKALDMQQLKQLCGELRAYILEVCSENPGHLGSSLGAVELIVGLHYVFDAPTDKLLFDVGHQAYAHKILTGRREAFKTLRQDGGISGFPNMKESPYDAFGVGHSSTAISAALGIAEAAKIQNLSYKVAALVGDGALTGGMSFEGLNNAGDSKADLLVILNDNNHSIDEAHGGLHSHLLKITTSKAYNVVKKSVWNTLGESRTRAFLQRWVRSLKSWFVKKTGGDIFEALGFRYFGPIDGNNIEKVVKNLRKLHDMQGPRILHAITVKGKGFEAAEKNPTIWHAPGKFNPSTGEREKVVYPASRYQDVFGQVLCELADQDPRVVGITPAMASGCGMTKFAQHSPDRFFDVGIEEEHAVTFSAGLAAGGMKPFCNIYSSFAQRAYDQIIHDVALQKLPVILCFDRAGLVGEDGATHQGSFDMSALRCIPGVTISAPSNEIQLKRLMYTALQQDEGPFVIRYPRGIGEGTSWQSASYETMPIGKGIEMCSGSETAIIGIGPVVHRAMEAAQGQEGKVGVYDMVYLKPLDEELLHKICKSYKRIITLEDGSLIGGLYSAVCEWMAANGYSLPVKGVGIPDKFIVHSRQSKQRTDCGLDAESIKKLL